MMIRKMLAYTLVMTTTWMTVWTAAPVFAQAPPAQSTEGTDQLIYEHAMARLDQFMKLIEELRSHIDRSQFDLDALLDKLDYDPEKIIHFVKDNIAFEQYPGLLRGAKGTLMSRAGNALDQSVLLATLLKDAGADARIARGKLSPEDARRLLDRMFLPRSARPPVGDLEAMDDVLRKVKTTTGGSGDGTNLSSRDPFTELRIREKANYDWARTTSADFQKRLKDAGIALGDPHVPEKLLVEAEDYFWVEYRLGVSGTWNPVHPAFGDQAGPSAQRTETIKDSIREDLQQRVRFEVEIEQQTAGRLVRKKVMSGWEGPTANLIGLQMRYANVPNNLNELSDFVDPQGMAEKTNFFIPSFNDKLAPGAQLFDLDGVTIPPEAGASPAAGVIKQVGKKTEAAAGALSALGAKPTPSGKTADIRSLTGVWLIFTLTAPGRSERTTYRTFFDPVGAERRKNGRLTGTVAEPDPVQATWEIASAVTFMVSPCDYPQAYSLDRGLEQILEARPVFQALLEQEHGGPGPGLRPQTLGQAQRTPEYMLFPAIAAVLQDSPRLVSYEATPTIVATWSKLDPRNGQVREEFATDIVEQGRRTLRPGPKGPVPATEAAMTSGVWATQNEQFAAMAGGFTGSMPVGAPEMLRSAAQNSIPLRVISPPQASQLDPLTLPAGMRSSIRAALAAGFVVVAPERLATGMFPGWWRVDPATGKTLGMGPMGRGIEVTAEAILEHLATALILATAWAATGLAICLSVGCSRKVCVEEAAKGWLTGLFVAAFLEVAIPLSAVDAVPGGLMSLEEVKRALDTLDRIENIATKVEWVESGIHVKEGLEMTEREWNQGCESESGSE